MERRMSEFEVGDIVHNAMWITGDEPLGMKAKYQRDVEETIDDLCEKNGFKHGPITAIEKRPGEYKVPPVPDHIQGSRVRLLVLEATVVDKLVIGNKPSFVNNLERKDLMQLRWITRQAALKNHNQHIGNRECDEIIEILGPDAALSTLKAAH
jgi:hypothetical protein|tara:strand:- start:559 stop:1017 length:459 start_codon:yes stop_codon:yes gene_type:complete